MCIHKGSNGSRQDLMYIRLQMPKLQECHESKYEILAKYLFFLQIFFLHTTLHTIPFVLYALLVSKNVNKSFRNLLLGIFTHNFLLFIAFSLNTNPNAQWPSYRETCKLTFHHLTARMHYSANNNNLSKIPFYTQVYAYANTHTQICFLSLCLCVDHYQELVSFTYNNKVWILIAGSHSLCVWR